MKLLYFMPILLTLALVQGCDEDDDPAPDSKPSPSASTPAPLPSVADPIHAAPQREQIQATVLFGKDKVTPIAFQQKEVGKSLFETEHPFILSSKIPDELTLEFPSHRDWLSGKVLASTPFAQESREIHAELLPSKPGANDQGGVDLKLQGLRNLFPDGPGLITSIALTVNANGTEQILNFKIGTPPSVPPISVSQIESAQMKPIQVSPSLSVVPIARIGISNTSLAPWAISIPYRPQAQWTQRIKKVVYNQTECAVQSEATEADEVATSQFLLIRSAIPPIQFSRLPLVDASQADIFAMNPQEHVELTLYVLLGSSQDLPLISGRRTTEAPRELSPGCKDGICNIREAYYDQLTFTRTCSPGQTITFNGWMCRTTVQGTCFRDGSCDYGPHLSVFFSLGPCLRYYKDPLPNVPFANYTDVLQSKLSLSQLFQNAEVHYSDSAFLSPDQASPIPWAVDQFVLN